MVSCPGTDSCKLGITSSMGLNRAIKERVDSMQISDELTKRIHIKMSGCPNGCSQHHIANIGFYGASLKVGGRQMPAYIPHIGGNFEGGEVIFGTRLKSRLPAKRVPEAVERWIHLYESDRDEGEEFNAFAERIGAEPFEAAGQGADPAGRVQPGDDAAVHRLEPLEPVRGRARRGGVRDLIAHPVAMKPPPVTLSGTVPTPADLDHEAIAAELEESTAQEALEWMFENFGAQHYIACSFQKTSSVTAHLATSVNPEARFFYLDTDVLFEETYETRDRLAEALGIEFDRFHNLTLEEQEAEHGPSCGIATPTPAAGSARSSRCAAPSLP